MKLVMVSVGCGGRRTTWFVRVPAREDGRVVVSDALIDLMLRTLGTADARGITWSLGG